MTRHPKSSTKPKSKGSRKSKGIVGKPKPISDWRKLTGKRIPIQKNSKESESSEESEFSEESESSEEAECEQFDIIGTLITEKSMTGANLTIQIFSHLDISSLFQVQMVSKTWRQNLDYGNISCRFSISWIQN